MARSRFIIGLCLIAIAAIMFIFGEGSYYTPGAITIGILGIVLVAISQRK
jgi:hypothetical protein